MANIIVKTEEVTKMKVIDMSTKESAKRYLTEKVENTHTKDELEALHRAIEFTKMFKHAESMAKMDEEEMIGRPLPMV